MNHSLRDQKIVFVGAGSMAEAIIRGLVEQQTANPERIAMINRSNLEKLAALSGKYGIRGIQETPAREEAIRNADIIVLAMKPKDAQAALSELAPLLHAGQMIVSVIAGLPIRTIESMIGMSMPIVRTMPNTSSTIGLGATGISYSSSVNENQRKIAKTMFESIGIAAEIEEPLIDAVTGVSGSGPAYIYYMMEAMIQGGVELGLSAEDAKELVVQTVLGAAQMVKTTGESPADLRRKVTSPNGTTQAALETLNEYRFAEGVHHAVRRAAERADEMGRQIAMQAEEAK